MCIYIYIGFVYPFLAIETACTVKSPCRSRRVNLRWISEGPARRQGSTRGVGSWWASSAALRSFLGHGDGSSRQKRGMVETIRSWVAGCSTMLNQVTVLPYKNLGFDAIQPSEMGIFHQNLGPFSQQELGPLTNISVGGICHDMVGQKPMVGQS